MQTKLQKIASCVTYPKEAHKSEQTNQPSPGTDISEIRAHQADTRRKAVARGAKVGLAEPMVRPNLP